MNRIRAALYVLMGRPVAYRIRLSGHSMIFDQGQKAIVDSCHFEDGCNIQIIEPGSRVSPVSPSPRWTFGDAIDAMNYKMKGE